jgi:hypothetical protein
MSKSPLAFSKAAAVAALLLYSLAGTGRADAANALVNGWYTQPGMNGSQFCGSGWSAALAWAQFAVVPSSYLCTTLETTFLPRIRVKTDGGKWPSAYMGNGIGQNFGPLPCAVASFWYNVVSGQVTGNLVSSVNNAFIDSNAVLMPVPNNPGAWRHFTSIWDKGAEGLYFETLSPEGIIRPVDYQLMNADVEPCVAAPPIKDLSGYIVATPFSYSADPAEPSVKIRVTNVSAIRWSGPLHLMMEGLGERMVANPDGDFLGTPYVTLVSSTLAPGQSEDVTVYFNPDAKGAVPAVQLKLASGNF